MLNLFVNFSIHKSIGTSLMANAFTAAAVSFMYFRHDNLDFKTALLLSSGSILGAQVGALALSSARIPEMELGGFLGLF